MDETTWNRLSEDWQREGRLAAAGAWWERKRWIHGISTLLEALGGLLGVGVALYFAVSNPKPAVIALAVFITLFMGTSFAFTVWNRRTLREGLPDDTRSFLETLRRRLEVEERLLSAGRVSFWVVTLFVAVWTPWMIGENWSAYAAEPWRAVVGVGGMLVIFAGVAVTMRRRRDKLTRESTWLRDLEEEFAREP